MLIRHCAPFAGMPGLSLLGRALSGGEVEGCESVGGGRGSFVSIVSTNETFQKNAFGVGCGNSLIEPRLSLRSLARPCYVRNMKCNFNQKWCN